MLTTLLPVFSILPYLFLTSHFFVKTSKAVRAVKGYIPNQPIARYELGLDVEQSVLAAAAKSPRINQVNLCNHTSRSANSPFFFSSQIRLYLATEPSLDISTSEIDIYFSITLKVSEILNKTMSYFGPMEVELAPIFTLAQLTFPFYLQAQAAHLVSVYFRNLVCRLVANLRNKFDRAKQGLVQSEIQTCHPATHTLGIRLRM
jgi:hypothetical protein